MKITVGYNGCYYAEYDEDEIEGLTEDEIVDKAINECYTETGASGIDFYQIDDNEMVEF